MEMFKIMLQELINTLLENKDNENYSLVFCKVSFAGFLSVFYIENIKDVKTSDMLIIFLEEIKESKFENIEKDVFRHMALNLLTI